MVCTYIGSGFFGCGSMLRCGYRTSWIVSLYNVVLSFRIDRCPIRSVSVLASSDGVGCGYGCKE